MTQEKSFSHSYPELFDLIERYGRGDVHQQAMALELIGKIYHPYYKLPPMEDARSIVENILEQYDYLFWYGGRPSLLGVDAVLATAMVNDDPNWGRLIFTLILQKLVQRNVEDLKQKEDLTYALTEVARGLQELQHIAL